MTPTTSALPEPGFPHEDLSADEQAALIAYVKSHTQQAATIEYRNYTGVGIRAAMEAVKHIQKGK